MSEEKKVRALLVTLVQNDYMETVDGIEKTMKGETRTYWYTNEAYPKEILDYGNFWEVDDSSTLNPTTPDGILVFDNRAELENYLDIQVDMGVILDEALALEPGQWVERPYDWYKSGCRVRMTAFAGLPQLSKERTLRNSDLSIRAMAKIRVNGEPLYAPGTIEAGTRAWFPDLYDSVVDAVVTFLRAKGGSSADVGIPAGGISVAKGNTTLSLGLKSKSREGLVEFLRGLGVPNPETVKVSKTTGDGNGVSCVYVLLEGVDHLED